MGPYESDVESTLGGNGGGRGSMPTSSMDADGSSSTDAEVDGGSESSPSESEELDEGEEEEEMEGVEEVADSDPELGVPAVLKKSSTLRWRKRRKRRKVDEAEDMSGVDGTWAESLKGPHLDLMIDLKYLAEVRMVNAGAGALAGCLIPSSLRAISIILEELLRDRMNAELPCSARVPTEAAGMGTVQPSSTLVQIEERMDSGRPSPALDPSEGTGSTEPRGDSDVAPLLIGWVEQPRDGLKRTAAPSGESRPSKRKPGSCPSG